MSGATRACDSCLARSWLLGRLAGHLDQVRAQIDDVLALPDEELIAAVGGRRQAGLEAELAGLDVRAVRERAARSELECICRCDLAYPGRLWELAAPPAALHVRGVVERFVALAAEEPVAIVGARRASLYGVEVAKSLARGLGFSGITVVSGMALGIDAAAHAGALIAGAPTIAVLPGPADRPYPASKRALHRQIAATGCAISELPPGTGVRRWMFPARNRIIAALAATTVVVEAGTGSGALVTARFAHELARPVGAVPGRINSPQAEGTLDLLAAGAYLVRGPQDVLDQVYGAGARVAASGAAREVLGADLRALLSAIADGHDTPAALARVGFSAERGLAAIAELELAGYVRRAAGGRFVVVG